jgi:dihydroneopterin triphosphate aldolase (PTPS-III) / 6-pyruvoyltetrahydropterin synthase
VRFHFKMPSFSVFVSKADFRFNCAHFIAFKGFRERLHGHNYLLSIKITGKETIGDDGYVIDFGDVKKATRKLCKQMNEYFLCPMKSDVLTITEADQQVCLVCEDGSNFSFPRTDVMMLPIIHSSAEELSHYFWCKIIRSAIISLYVEW